MAAVSRFPRPTELDSDRKNPVSSWGLRCNVHLSLIPNMGPCGTWCGAPPLPPDLTDSSIFPVFSPLSKPSPSLCYCPQHHLFYRSPQRQDWDQETNRHPAFHKEACCLPGLEYQAVYKNISSGDGRLWWESSFSNLRMKVVLLGNNEYFN